MTLWGRVFGTPIHDLGLIDVLMKFAKSLSIPCDASHLLEIFQADNLTITIEVQTKKLCQS